MISEVPDKQPDPAPPDGKTGGRLHAQVLDAIRCRLAWEMRQRVWYQMRHGGLRRQNKPFPGAADQHLPIVDTAIEKLKPFYASQIYALDTLASFISLKEQDANLTSSAAQFLDYQIKQRSGFETEIITCIDHMLMSGRAVMKVVWDRTAQRLKFTAVNPLYIIVPEYTRELMDADWLVHVIHLSEQQYRSNPNLVQDDDTIKSILHNAGTGGGTHEGDEAGYVQDKTQREGLTYSKQENEIILWERWERGKDRSGRPCWVCRTYSPSLPDKELRDPIVSPYDHGELPFVSFVTEVKDKGWLSPRGLPEILGSFESYGCKLWNAKCDHITFSGHPLFKIPKDANPNVRNITFEPGTLVPFDLEVVQFPAPPLDLDQEIQFVRGVAEERAGSPDFGLGDRDGKGPRTATEINQIGGLSQQSNDIRARLFRISMGLLLRQAWALLVQFDDPEIRAYVASNEIQQLPDEARHTEYLIAPSGSADSWNRSAQAQRAVTRKQLFANSPWINQPELDKSILELDDASLVKRLFQDPNEQQQRQASLQAIELGALTQGYPLVPNKSDDDSTHVQVIHQWITGQVQKQKKGEPDVIQAARGHRDAHVQAALQKDPKQGRLLAQQVGQFEKGLVQLEQQILLQQQQQQQAAAASAGPSPLLLAGGSVPGNPGMGPVKVGHGIIPTGPAAPSAAPGPAAAAPGGPAAAPEGPAPNTVANPTLTGLAALLQALVAAHKAGIPVSRDEFSAAFVAAGLPALPSHQDQVAAVTAGGGPPSANPANPAASPAGPAVPPPGQ